MSKSKSVYAPGLIMDRFHALYDSIMIDIYRGCNFNTHTMNNSWTEMGDAPIPDVDVPDAWL